MTINDLPIIINLIGYIIALLTASIVVVAWSLWSINRKLSRFMTAAAKLNSYKIR